MKTLFIGIFLICLFSQASGQKLNFAYDSAGNQINRAYFCPTCAIFFKSDFFAIKVLFLMELNRKDTSFGGSLFNSISYNTWYFKKNNIALSKISRESNRLLIKSNIL